MDYTVNPLGDLAAPAVPASQGLARLLLRGQAAAASGAPLLDGKVISYDVSTGLAVVTVRGVAVPDIPNIGGQGLKTNDVVLLANYGPSYVILGSATASFRTPQPELDWLQSSSTVSVPNAGSVVTTVAGFSRVSGITNPGYLSSIVSGVMTVGLSGLYDLNASLTFSAGTAAGRRLVAFFLNGSEIRRVDGGNASAQTPELVHKHYLVAGDTLEIRAYQSSGAALSLGGGHEFQMMRVHG